MMCGPANAHSIRIGQHCDIENILAVACVNDRSADKWIVVLSVGTIHSPKPYGCVIPGAQKQIAVLRPSKSVDTPDPVIRT